MSYLSAFRVELIDRLSAAQNHPDKWPELARWISDKHLESYKNGVKAGRKGKSESKNSQAPSDLPIVPQA